MTGKKTKDLTFSERVSMDALEVVKELPLKLQNQYYEWVTRQAYYCMDPSDHKEMCCDMCVIKKVLKAQEFVERVK